MIRILCTILLLVLLPAALVAAWLLRTTWALVTVAALLLLFAAAAGKLILGLWRGACLDARNKVSLSRLQILLWTVLIASALLAAALHNVRTDQDDPLVITLSPELLILFGISATSLVGAGLIKREKSHVKPEEDSSRLVLGRAHGTEPANIVWIGSHLAVARDSADPGTARVVAKGLLIANDKPEESSWLDLFRGEEVGNLGRLDLGKIQVCYFTVVVIFAYAVAVVSLLSTTSGKIAALPGLNEGVIALLGISHAAYLTNKAVSSTPTSREV